MSADDARVSLSGSTFGTSFARVEDAALSMIILSAGGGSDVRPRGCRPYGRGEQNRSSRRRCARSGSARRGRPARAGGIRSSAHGLERDDRPEAGPRGALYGCRRRCPLDPLRARTRSCAGGSRRWPQHRRERRLRRRPAARSVADAIRLGGRDKRPRARRTGGHAGRLRPRSAGIRLGHAARRQLDDGGCRADARWRLRLAQPEVRSHGRQSAVR